MIIGYDNWCYMTDFVIRYKIPLKYLYMRKSICSQVRFKPNKLLYFVFNVFLIRRLKLIYLLFIIILNIFNLDYLDREVDHGRHL